VVQSLYIRTLGLVVSVGYAALIGWLYVHQPQSVSEVTGGLAANIGAYQIDQQAFDEGLRLFRGGQFAAARAAFDRADGAHRDPNTEFYIAYSWYREGWGRIYNDDQMFTRGLEAANRAIALSPHGILRVEDADLGMRTADELRAELEAGLTRNISDLNPMRVFRQRK
jgi:tetratricopeptide (TPR) repeat protein